MVSFKMMFSTFRDFNVMQPSVSNSVAKITIHEIDSPQCKY